LVVILNSNQRALEITGGRKPGETIGLDLNVQRFIRIVDEMASTGHDPQSIAWNTIDGESAILEPYFLQIGIVAKGFQRPSVFSEDRLTGLRICDLKLHFQSAVRFRLHSNIAAAESRFRIVNDKSSIRVLKEEAWIVWVDAELPRTGYRTAIEFDRSNVACRFRAPPNDSQIQFDWRNVYLRIGWVVTRLLCLDLGNNQRRNQSEKRD
jgi:hypothetical protein